MLSKIFKIVRAGPPPLAVPYIAQKRLNIFCFWVTRRNRLGEPIEPALFTQAAVEIYGTMMAISKESADEENIEKHRLNTKPVPNGKHSKKVLSPISTE
jgi:hypothetical protein